MGRVAAAAQSKVMALVLLISHARNHAGGQEMRDRPGSGIVFAHAPSPFTPESPTLALEHSWMHRICLAHQTQIISR